MNSAEAVAFINRTLGHAQRAERLASGADTHLLRVHREAVPSSVLVRRLERTVFTDPAEYALGVQRLAREVRALRLFETNGPLHALRTELDVPSVLVAELRTRTVVLEDLLRYRTEAVPFDFGALGRFLASLHSAGRLRTHGWLRRVFDQAPSHATCLVFGSLSASTLVARQSRRPALVGWGDLRAGTPSEDVVSLAASLWHDRGELPNAAACWAAFGRAYSAACEGAPGRAEWHRSAADMGVPTEWFDQLATG